jgi:hypothetical protein
MMGSLWETMVGRWLGQKRRQAPGEASDLPDFLAADTVPVGVEVRRESTAFDRTARPSDAPDVAPAIEPTLLQRIPE